MSKGWIKLYRKIEDNVLWQDKPFSKGQAWIDILLDVNHCKNEVLIGNKIEEVNPGEKITSIRKLCERWGWSNTKVKSFLDLLKKQRMIEYKSDTKKTVIKVLNYGDYQHSNIEENDTKTSQKHIKNISKTYQKHTNKNVKNVKNDKENNYSSDKSQNESKFDINSTPYKAALKLREYIKENNPRQPVPKENPKDMHSWSLEMDRLNRLGTIGATNKGYSWQEIRKIMDWCQQDDFWKDNIQSAATFRKQITKLENQMKKDSNFKPNKKEDKQATRNRILEQQRKLAGRG